jgi:hypothetical protein
VIRPPSGRIERAQAATNDEQAAALGHPQLRLNHVDSTSETPREPLPDARSSGRRRGSPLSVGNSPAFSIAWSESTQREAKPRSRSFASRPRGRSRFAQPCWPPPHDPAIISSLCCEEKTTRASASDRGRVALKNRQAAFSYFFFFFFVVPSLLPFLRPVRCPQPGPP